MRLQEIQFWHQVPERAVESFDRRAAPLIIEGVQKELAGTIESTAADPDWA
jgi:hypothetical protein